MTPSTPTPDQRPGAADRPKIRRRRIDDDALDAILGADLAPELGESLGEAFDAARSGRLRRRAAWYFGTLAVLALARLPMEFVDVARGTGAGRWTAIASVAAAVIALTATVSLVAWVLTLRPDRRRLVRAVTATIVIFGTLDIVAGTFLAPGAGPGVAPDAAAGVGAGVGISIGPGSLPPDAVPFLVLAGMLTTHLAACLFLPWTPRECLRPLAPLLVVFPAVTIPFGPAATGVAIAAAVVSPLVGAPGLLICTWRHGRERSRFLLGALQDEVRDSRRELATARAIHESMLPESIATGPIRMHYAFEPVRDLGGDFLVVHRDDARVDAPLTVVLLDVTGHGVTAALGATRLHGELQRTLEEHPDLSPGDLLVSANAACRRILSRHAIFATAFAARLFPRDGRLEWASAGHLPGMILRGPGGGTNASRIVRLPATCTMLGVLDAPAFDPGRRGDRLIPGDRLVLVTDGIVEARTMSGRRLEQDGTERLIRRAAGRRDVGEAGSGRFPARFLRSVERFSDGPAEDDRVVVELARTP